MASPCKCRTSQLSYAYTHADADFSGVMTFLMIVCGSGSIIIPRRTISYGAHDEKTPNISLNLQVRALKRRRLQKNC